MIRVILIILSGALLAMAYAWVVVSTTGLEVSIKPRVEALK
jgi:hypothetical protein